MPNPIETPYAKIDEKALLKMTDREFLTVLLDHLRDYYKFCASCRSKSCVFKSSIPVFDHINWVRIGKPPKEAIDTIISKLKGQ